MPLKTTRRGLLRGTVGTAALATAPSCSRELTRERFDGHGSPVDSGGARAQTEVSTTVNGVSRTLHVGPDASALSVLRDELGLTGAKLACGHGACGACTVRVDDTPVAGCLLPASSLHGREVTTVEGLARDGGDAALHPVQRAFMAEDALQCGYCTPGFVVEATAFYDRWRARNGTTRPDEDEVAEALSGHLCRCGAYRNIIAAVQGACAGAYEQPTTTSPRHDARAKVTGAAKYTVDVRVEGMLYGAILRAPVAHATITRLDWTRARAAPGVHGAVEFRGVGRVVRYAGQALLAIAADTEARARAALQLVDIGLDEHPPLVGLDAGLDPNAPPLYSSRKTRKSAPNANESPLLPVGWSGNLRGPFKLFSKKRGAARRAVDARGRAPDGGHVVRGTWETQTQCHTCMEPHACVADWRDDGLTVHLSTQAVFHMHEDIAKRWKLKRDRVRVVAQFVGGGFGGKAALTDETLAAVELSRTIGRPVRVVLDRREELAVGGNRPAQRTEFALAADPDGMLEGVTAKSFADSGVAVGAAPSILYRIMYADTPKYLEDWDVLTHAAPGKPLRAPGGPPAFWALEQAIDELAHKRGEDPIAVRRRFDPNPARERLYDWAAALPAWQRRAPVSSDRGRYRRGIGLAAAGWFYFVQPNARVKLDATSDGFVASTASQDMGNGTRSVIARGVADVMGIDPREVEVRVGDSRFVPGPMSAGSRTTASLYPAATHAALALREELVEHARRAMGLAGAAAVAGGVRHGERVYPWAELLASAPALSVVGKRKRDKGGYFMPPIMDLAPGRYIAGALHLSAVEVDTRLGRVRVTESWVGIGAGKIHAPTLARSQVEGGVIQGVGFALYEERRLDPAHGYLLSAGLEDYRLPGVGDVGPIHVHFMEEGFERANGRGVGIGEIVKLGPAPAIGNAVFNATGWRPRELPLRPDRVLKGLRS